MKNKKITNNSKTTAQLSNPNMGIPHEELLKKAGIKTFTEYEIEDLGNGIIKVNPKIIYGTPEVKFKSLEASKTKVIAKN